MVSDFFLIWLLIYDGDQLHIIIYYFFVIELKMHHSSYFVLQHLNDLWLALCMLALIDWLIYLLLTYLFAFCLFPCIHLTHSDLGTRGCHKKCLKCLDLYNLFFSYIVRHTKNSAVCEIVILFDGLNSQKYSNKPVRTECACPNKDHLDGSPLSEILEAPNKYIRDAEEHKDE